MVNPSFAITLFILYLTVICHCVGWCSRN